MKKLISIIILITFFPVFVFPRIETPVKFSDARVMGMGNTFTAIADDKNMLFFNPAGFADYGLIKVSKLDAIRDPTLWKPRYANIGELTITSFTFGMNYNLIDKYGAENIFYYFGLQSKKDSSKPLFYLLDTDFFTKFGNGELTYDEIQEAKTYLDQLYYTVIHSTVYVETFSYARHYFGWGLFHSFDSVIEIEPEGFLPMVKYTLIYDFIIPFGIGFHIPEHKQWSAGITFKYFTRTKLYSHNINDLATLYNYYKGEYFNTEVDINNKSYLDLLLNGVDYTEVGIDQIKIGTGTGFDIGVMYRPTFNWRFGLLFSDVYTRIRWWDGTESSPIPPNIRIGVAYMPGVSLWGFFEDPILAVDVEDILHQERKNFFLKWHFGAEFKLLFRLLTIRFGINEGYPSAGVGTDLSLYFLSKFPVLKHLRPKKLYFPVFDPGDKDFSTRNPLFWLITVGLFPVLYSHIKIDVSYTGFELGERPGDLGDYQLLVKVSYTLAY